MWLQHSSTLDDAEERANACTQNNLTLNTPSYCVISDAFTILASFLPSAILEKVEPPHIYSLTNKQTKIQTRKKLLKTERSCTEQQQAKLKNTSWAKNP
jgi:hypothetical protein